jgi:hypothetical protein
LARWLSSDNSGDGKPVWTLDKYGKPWPILVRLGGKDTAGKTGLADTEFSEVLEFDAELNPKPDSQADSTYLKVITGTAPVEKRGLFDRANVKVF